MSGLKNCVLIVEDEIMNVMWLEHMLETMGRSVCGAAATVEEAVRLAAAHRPGLVLMDMRLEGEGDGVDATRAIYDLVGSKVVFVTASTDQATLRRISSVNPMCVLTKPVSVQKLQEAVDDAFSGRHDRP